MAKGFLIGETLLGQIKDTVKRVDGMPEGRNFTRIPTRFESMPVAQSGEAFRICTFTGAWSVGSEKTVTFKNQTATPNTASATNLFWPIPEGAQRDCAIAKDGSQWYLLVPPLESGTALSSATLGDSLQFGRINVLSLGTASTVSISTTTCTT